MNTSASANNGYPVAKRVGWALMLCLASALTVQAAGPVDQLVIVFKTHFDIGYTDMAKDVVLRYRTKMIDQALEVCDRNRDLPPAQQFAWTIPGWPMKKIAEDWEGQTPERKQRIQRAFQDGRFVVHALPFTTHTELLEAEDLVRGLGFASQLSRSAGLALPRDAKMTDVPSHSWIMPTLLRHAGVDLLHIGCNAACRSPQVPMLFWWEGPDGSRLLTFYSAEGYGTGLIPPPDWPYKTWLALIHTGDNHGPPTPEEVKKVLDEAKQKLPGVKVRIGRLSDFADGILAEKPNLPVIRGDMPDTWIHGPMCDPAGAKLARNIRPAITATESLHTQLNAWGLQLPAATDTVAAAYEQSLLYGEHTWGGALYWVTKYSGDRKFFYGDAFRTQRSQDFFRRLEDSWREHTAYIETARNLIAPVLDRDLAALAGAVSVAGWRITVYNPLPWQRSDLVTVKTDRQDVTALQALGGQEVVPVEVKNGQLRFLADQVPPLGYRTYVPVKTSPILPSLSADPQAATIENACFKATLDAACGAVRSLIDQRTGRELVDTAAPHGFGQYLYERFDANNTQAFVKAYIKINADWAFNELGKPNLPPADQVPYRAASPKNCQLTFEKTSVSVTAIMASAASADLPHAVTTKLVLYGDKPYADLEVTLHDKPADPWPEAGWICLPCKVAAPQFRLGRLASLVDPAKDVVRGTNRHLFGVNSGLTMTDPQGRGVGLCSIDNPLISLDTPGCWKYSLDFVPQRPAAYVNLFNNQWTTNFRMWNEGTWTSRVRLWAIGEYQPEAALVTPSQESRFPLLAAAYEGASGTLPPTQAGLELGRKGVAVTAFGPHPDGPGVLLRLWEQAGQAGKCRVQLPNGMSAKCVQPVDLRGQATGEPLVAQGGTFEANLSAFAPASYVIK